MQREVIDCLAIAREFSDIGLLVPLLEHGRRHGLIRAADCAGPHRRRDAAEIAV